MSIDTASRRARAAGAARNATRATEGKIGPELVAEAVTFEGVVFRPRTPVGDIYLGEITYGSGTTFVGEVRFINYPTLSTWGYGTVAGSTDSWLVSFAGEVARPAAITAQPAQGITIYRDGSSFSGLHYVYFGSTSASGIFESADRKRRFVGTVDFVQGAPQPLSGITEDAEGRLLAIVRSD